MNNLWLNQAVKVFLYILLQVVVLKEIHLDSSNQKLIYILVYPVVLITMPLRIPQFFHLVIAFAVGITVDMFYLSPGVHAGACLWMAACRPLALKLLEPKNGYPLDTSPTINDFGIMWFMQYASILLLVFFFSYFTLQVFTFVYAAEILLKTTLSFFVSGIIILLFQLFFSFRS